MQGLQRVQHVQRLQHVPCLQHVQRLLRGWQGDPPTPHKVTSTLRTLCTLRTLRKT